MDWRSGKPNTTGSPFRGISTRGRGRGRARGGPSSSRGTHAGTSTEPALNVTPPPMPETPSQGPPAPALNLPPRPKSASRRGSHSHARRAPSLSHLDLPKAGATPTEQQTALAARPQVARRASHNPIVVSPNEASSSQIQISSGKLDPSTPTTPSSPRPKPSRKRSQIRTRSSSKVSVQDRLSATASVASAKEKEKDPPPHLSLASAPPNVQSFELRSNIDTLVERVRAMAMAGSAADKDKDKEGHFTPNDGHIDWAGDDDDTLPDLDDWVRPKSAEPKDVNKSAEDKLSDKPVLSPVEEVSPGLPSHDKRQEPKKEETTGRDGGKESEKNQRAEEAKDVKELKATNEVNSSREKESNSGRTKTRGKNGRKKGSNSESLPAEPTPQVLGSKSSHTESMTQTLSDSNASSAPKIRTLLVHPLPPKPQTVTSPVRGSKSRTPLQATPASQPTIRLSEEVLRELPPTVPPPKEETVLEPPIELVGSAVKSGDCGIYAPEINNRELNDNVDLAKVSRSSDVLSTEANSNSKEGDVVTPPVKIGQANTLASIKGTSPTRRPSTRGSPSPKRGRPFSPPSVPHPQTAPPHARSRAFFSSSRNGSPPVIPDLAHDPRHPAQTRSQVNSPESSPRRWLNNEGLTHLRSHSSPQTGPGTRTHASRPVITLDAISRISRTLGVGATTPPRGQAASVVVNE